MTIAFVNVPTANAVNVTLRLSALPGCNVVGVVRPWTAKGGSMVIVSTVRGAVPRLLTVTAWDPLVVPTLWLANVKDELLSPATAPVLTPIPVKGTMTGLTPVTLIMSWPLKFLGPSGTKLTPKRVFFPGEIVVGNHPVTN